jgi:hypothetical protein
MGDVRWLLGLAAAISTLQTVSCGSPRIAHSQYVYRYPSGQNVCVYASFEMSFNIYYDNGDKNKEPPYRDVKLPDNKNVNITGRCSDTEPEMTLLWKNNSLRMTFEAEHGKWELKQITFVFNLTSENFTMAKYTGLQSFHTNGTDLFRRTFKKNQYFYCENCKTFQFGGNNESLCEGDCQTPCVQYGNKSDDDSYCSSVHMRKSVIFLGDPSNASKQLCLEDYIALQEIIVPSVVGGVLALLLVLIFLAYVIAYVRRRRREAKAQYEPVGDF